MRAQRPCQHVSRYCSGRIKHRKCIFDQYTWVKGTFGTGKSQPSYLTSGAFYVFAQQRPFPCIFLPIWWAYLRNSTRKFNRGRRWVTTHGITQPHLVRWQGLYTMHYSCILWHWNMFTFFKWPLSVPFELPMTMLGERWLELPNFNSSGTSVRDFCVRFVATPQCRKLTYALWVLDEQKCKLQKHKLTVLFTLCRSVGCFGVWYSFSGRYLVWWIWLENCHFHNYVLSLTGRTQLR